jgi:hypothetical protein
VVSLTARPVYPRVKEPYTPLERRLGGPQSRSGLGGEEKIILSCRESSPGRPTHSLVTISIELPQLLRNGRSFINCYFYLVLLCAYNWRWERNTLNLCQKKTWRKVKRRRLGGGEGDEEDFGRTEYGLWNGLNWFRKESSRRLSGWLRSTFEFQKKRTADKRESMHFHVNDRIYLMILWRSAMKFEAM